MAELSNPSSKYDYITCKELIHSGSPSVYQLIPKRENIGTLTKMTLGKRDPNRTNRTVLLVGETGAGKSTLINALVNYAIGVTWEDNVWFEIVEEEEKKAQSESQTPDVIVYEIFGFEDKTLPYSLTLIDTPGYGDTRGTEQDDKVSQRLFDLFGSVDGVYEMNVVGLVLKASDNRLSDRLRYIFDSVISLFGKDLEENIITLVSHSDGRTPREALNAVKKADIKCATNEKYQPVHFLFNNCQNSERTEKNLSASQSSWGITSRGLSEFTSFLQNLLPRNLKNTTEVLNSRITLTACIQNLQDRVELIEKQQKEIQQTHEALTKHKDEMESIENFRVEVDVPYKVKEKIRGGMWGLVFYEGAVCCNICEENCHYPGCTMAWYPRDCGVMSRGKCTSCTKGCPVSDHVKKPEKYVTKTEKVVMTIKDVKQKYEKSEACSADPEEEEKHFEMIKLSLKEREEKNGKSKADSVKAESQKEDSKKDKEKMEKHLEDFKKAKTTLEERREKYEKSKADREDTTRILEGLQRKMEELQKDKIQWLKEAFQHVVKLEKIALNTDSLSTHVHLDFLMEKMKECRDSSEKDKFQNEVQKLEEMKCRVDDQKAKALKYKQTTPGKADEAKAK
ncbi:uncharacterized protein LOC141805429 isoform X2 [Halichoeres trimaculatus]|uniref:uncharacterized protein LOC141805429 isoform X2 n=1 Tax=Halichoeres trimaculatus TaxID=147232 RepID=UPI003D9E0BED